VNRPHTERGQEQPPERLSRRRLRYTVRVIARDPLAMFSLVIILLLLVMALFGPWIVPYPEQGAGRTNVPDRFAPLFTRAWHEGLGITVHAGEAGGADNVRTAVQLLHARRIERNRPFAFRDRLNLTFRHEENLRVRIDESRDQPWTSDAVDMHVRTCDPFHQTILLAS